jgi:GT2 family glycosyltransferase
MLIDGASEQRAVVRPMVHTCANPKVSVSGKFLHTNGGRFLIRGVSYGTFAPDANRTLFPEPDRVARDFKAIAALGANTVRTYTPPPPSLLDEAAQCGLRVIVGLAWPQHVAFLDSRSITREIRTTIGGCVDRLASHPATLLFAIGNEIPPSVVRWYGRGRVERFLRELYEEAKTAAPDALLTYVNYPPTEYLESPFFDICAFNVFLHGEAELRAYLARLHHVAGPRPLLVAEAGADSVRNGEQHQAALVRMQLRTAFGEGACGAIVFSWTDDWWRGGRRVDDWAFGLVDSGRRPKPAYQTVQRVFQSAPFRDDQPATWPRVSVIVCAYNAADTIDECLDAIERLRYPDVEVILVNDGSTDRTRSIAARHPAVRVIDIANTGLASARNVGLAHATGDIVAYTDADVRVDPDWLTYLVQPFVHSDVVAAGGPNLVPAEDPWVAQCVARAPGGPTHVLLDDRLAEHIPGCNCAFRRDALVAIGGFNPTFLRAGDDVDVCWRLQARGWNIGFAPAALVWHHHRASVRAYLRQQIGYGEGETWLMRQHPEKFIWGRIAWRGHIYSPLPFIRSLSAMRINAGPFGSAAFPSIYRTGVHPLAYMPHSGRWQIAWVILFVLGALAASEGKPYSSALWVPALMAMAATGIKCLLYGLRSDVAGLPRVGRLSLQASRGVYRVTIAAFHFLQPFARVYGRVRGALSRRVSRPSLGSRWRPFLRPAARAALADGVRLFFSRQREKAFWSEKWIDVSALLSAIADRLRRERRVRYIELDSGWWEDRDLTVVNRGWLRLDIRALVEDHGGGRCLCRLRMRLPVTAAILPLVLGIAAVTVLHRAGLIAWPLGAIVFGVVAATIAVGDMVVTSSALSNTVDRVAAELGMSPMESHEKEASRLVPHEVPRSAGSSGPGTMAGARDHVRKVPSGFAARVHSTLSQARESD